MPQNEKKKYNVRSRYVDNMACGDGKRVLEHGHGLNPNMDLLTHHC